MKILRRVWPIGWPGAQSGHRIDPKGARESPVHATSVVAHLIQEEFNGANGFLPLLVLSHTSIREPAAAPAGRNSAMAIQFLFEAPLRKYFYRAYLIPFVCQHTGPRHLCAPDHHR